MIAHWKASFFTIAIFAFGAITIPATGCALVVEKITKVDFAIRRNQIIFIRVSVFSYRRMKK